MTSEKESGALEEAKNFEAPKEKDQKSLSFSEMKKNRLERVKALEQQESNLEISPNKLEDLLARAQRELLSASFSDKDIDKIMSIFESPFDLETEMLTSSDVLIDKNGDGKKEGPKLDVQKVKNFLMETLHILSKAKKIGITGVKRSAVAEEASVKLNQVLNDNGELKIDYFVKGD